MKNDELQAGEVWFHLCSYNDYHCVQYTVTKVKGLFWASSLNVSDHTFPGPENGFLLYVEKNLSQPEVI
jgi:hypothetical protein